MFALLFLTICYLLFLHVSLGCTYWAMRKDRGGWAPWRRHRCKVAAKKIHCMENKTHCYCLWLLCPGLFWSLQPRADCSVSICKVGNASLLLNGSTQDESQAQLITTTIPQFSQNQVFAPSLKLEKSLLCEILVQPKQHPLKKWAMQS